MFKPGYALGMAAFVLALCALVLPAVVDAQADDESGDGNSEQPGNGDSDGDSDGDANVEEEPEADMSGRIGVGFYPCELTDECDTRDDGQYFQEFPYWGVAGNTISVSMLADSDSGLDAWIRIAAPDGTTYTNDNADRGTTDARLEDTELTETGIYVITTSSADAGQTGAYSLQIGTQTFATLDDGDATLPHGQFCDTMYFWGTRGETLVIFMTADTVDCEVELESPSGHTWSNDDHLGDSGRVGLNATDSFLRVQLPETGRYLIRFLSLAAGDSGDYMAEVF